MTTMKAYKKGDDIVVLVGLNVRATVVAVSRFTGSLTVRLAESAGAWKTGETMVIAPYEVRRAEAPKGNASAILLFLASLAAVGISACSGTESVVVVTVEAAAGIPAVSRLRASFTNAGHLDERTFPAQAASGGAMAFPTAFSVTLSTSRVGELDVGVDGLSAAGLAVAHGVMDGIVMIQPGGRADVTVVLAACPVGGCPQPSDGGAGDVAPGDGSGGAGGGGAAGAGGSGGAPPDGGGGAGGDAAVEAAVPPPCDLVSGVGCGAGLRCAFNCSPWTISCTPPGSKMIGETCATNDDCVAGTACGLFSKCYKMCRVAADCPSGSTCAYTSCGIAPDTISFCSIPYVPPPLCNPVTNAGCDSMHKCVPKCVSGTTEYHCLGALGTMTPIGGPCGLPYDNCVAKSVCLEYMSMSKCYQFCNTDADCAGSGTCSGIGLSCSDKNTKICVP